MGNTLYHVYWSEHDIKSRSQVHVGISYLFLVPATSICCHRNKIIFSNSWKVFPFDRSCRDYSHSVTYNVLNIASHTPTKMSSASLPNKRSSKVPHIDSTSSITSAPTSTAASRLKARTTNRMKEQHQPKQRSSNLLDKSPNRRVRASNYELSSSDANENEAHKNRLRKTKSSTMGCSATDLQTNEPTVKKSNPVLDDMQQELSEVSKMR